MLREFKQNVPRRTDSDRIDEAFDKIVDAYVDEHGEEVELFVQYELPVFENLIAIELDGTQYTLNDFWSAVHFASQFVWQFKGWTPYEVVRWLYMANDAAWVANFIFRLEGHNESWPMYRVRMTSEDDE